MGQEQSSDRGEDKKEDKFDYDRLEIAAIRDNDIAKFESLLALGLDVHDVNRPLDETIFAACIKHQRWEIFQKALERVTDPNAAGKGNVLVSQFVKSMQPQEHRYLTAFLAKFGDQVDLWKTGEHKVSSAIDVIRVTNNWTVLYALHRCIGPKLFERKECGGNLLNLTATDNSYRVTKHLIKLGCPAVQDDQGRTPLMNAIYAGRPRTLKMLMFAYQSLINVADNDGNTPVIEIVRMQLFGSGHINHAALLGADPLKQNDKHESALSLMKEHKSNHNRDVFCNLFGLPPLPPVVEEEKKDDDSDKEEDSDDEDKPKIDEAKPDETKATEFELKMAPKLKDDSDDDDDSDEETKASGPVYGGNVGTFLKLLSDDEEESDTKDETEQPPVEAMNTDE